MVRDVCVHIKEKRIAPESNGELIKTCKNCLSKNSSLVNEIRKLNTANKLKLQVANAIADFYEPKNAGWDDMQKETFRRNEPSH